MDTFKSVKEFMGDPEIEPSQYEDLFTKRSMCIRWFKEIYMNEDKKTKLITMSRTIALGTCVFLYGAIPFILGLMNGQMDFNSFLLAMLGVAINVLRYDTDTAIERIKLGK
jgi:hypothetical protein